MEDITNEENAAVPEELAALPDHKESITLDLQLPDPETVVQVMNHRLRLDFREVSVEWVDCPDLRTFGFVAPGLCGKPALFELGNLSYLFPTPRQNKTYNFINLLEQFKLTHQYNFIIGAGKYSNRHYCEISELCANFAFTPASPTDGSMNVQNNSFACWSLEDNACMLHLCCHLNPTCEIQGNFFLSEGRPGRVLKVTALYREGMLDFISAIQVLLPLLKTEGDARMIGLGGIFSEKGTIPHLYHVTPPRYSHSMLYTRNQIQEWLHYKKMWNPSRIAVGTIMSEGSYYNNICPSYTENLYVTKSHFHTTLGHLYTNYMDDNYRDVHYLGYFSFAEKLYCVDPPSDRDRRTTIPGV